MGIVKSLPCKLTAEELRIKGESLGRIVKSIDAVEEEKKKAVSAFGERLKKLRDMQEQTSSDVVNASELREIMCTEQPDHENHMVDVIRNDTKEVVERRPMTEEEMQGNLFAIDGGAGAEDDDEASDGDVG